MTISFTGIEGIEPFSVEKRSKVTRSHYTMGSLKNDIHVLVSEVVDEQQDINDRINEMRALSEETGVDFLSLLRKYRVDSLETLVKALHEDVQSLSASPTARRNVRPTKGKQA